MFYIGNLGDPVNERCCGGAVLPNKEIILFSVVLDRKFILLVLQTIGDFFMLKIQIKIQLMNKHPESFECEHWLKDWT